MTRYFVSFEIACPDLMVEADSPEEAKEIAEAFIEDKGRDYQEMVMAMDAYVDQVDEADPDVYDTSLGLSAKHPFDLHNLDEEGE